jgi:hypothetical protein
MKRAIIRCLWGIYDRSSHIVERRYHLDSDITGVRDNPYELPFVVYVFGEENYRQITDIGFQAVLVDKNPAPYDLIKHHYRHKLEIMRKAMEDDGIDELLLLDWDCQPFLKVPDDMWEILAKKDVIQANLQSYIRRKCRWRKEDMRKVPNAGFVYIRDKSLPSKIISAWEMNPDNSAEPPMGYVIDQLMGGWKGIEHYWEHFEPNLCNLHKDSAYSESRILEKPNYCFRHTQGNYYAKLRRLINSNGVKQGQT